MRLWFLKPYFQAFNLYKILNEYERKINPNFEIKNAVNHLQILLNSLFQKKECLPGQVVDNHLI